MTDNEIDSALEGSFDSKQQSTTKTESSYGKTEKVSLYKNTNIIAVDVNEIKQIENPNRKEFSVTIGGDIPEDKSRALLSVCKYLFGLGFTYRSPGDNRNNMDNSIREVIGSKAEVFKLWNKAKTEVGHHSVKSEETTMKAYQVAAGLHKKFLQQKDFVRCIYARDTQLMLGKECSEPVNFILIYTGCGQSGFTSKFKIENSGSVWYVLKTAKEAKIPVFNVNSPTFKEDFKAYLISTGHVKETNTQATQQVANQPAAQPVQQETQQQPAQETSTPAEAKPASTEIKVEEPMALPEVEELF